MKIFTMPPWSAAMATVKKEILEDALLRPALVRGSWQAEGASYATYEVANAVIEHSVTYPSRKFLQEQCEPDLPWADDHFAERVGGKPLNPAPSFLTWPWHSQKEAQRHIKADNVFDHTYPERMWPKQTGWPKQQVLEQEGWSNQGIRFAYGDLDDVIAQLQRDPWTRQAYLPLWFPEDTGARDRVTGRDIRVPCTLGYHFIRNGMSLDMNYFMRSCDVTRHLHNDLYLAARLLGHVVSKLDYDDDFGLPYPGKVTTFISNLHIFEGDLWRYRGATTA